MKVVKEKLESGNYTLDVTVSTQEVSNALNAAGIQFCTQMGIQPMSNKTPAQAASEQMGIKDLDSVVNSQAIEALIPLAIEKSGIVPAYTPEAKPKSPLRRGHTFAFSLEVMPKPVYELKSYDPVAITVEPYTPDLTMVDQEIAKLAETYTAFVATDPHPIAKGDSAKLKIEATKDGEPMKGLCTEGRTYTIGIGLMPEGFDNALLGMEPGETRSFTFEGPDIDADGNQFMEEYEATVTLLECQKETAPVINDEWVAINMPMYKGLDDLRREIERAVNDHTRRQYDDYVRNMAAAEMATRFDGRIDDPVYEGMMSDITRNLRAQVTASGSTWEKYLEAQGGEQSVKMMLMMQTRAQLVQGFALDAVYRHFGLTSTDADVDEVCRQMDARNPRRVRNQMEKAGLMYALRESAERLAACRYLVEHADITIRESEEDKPVEPEGEAEE